MPGYLNYRYYLALSEGSVITNFKYLPVFECMYQNPIFEYKNPVTDFNTLLYTFLITNKINRINR